MRLEPEIVAFLGDRPPGEFAVVPPVVAELEYGLQRLDSASRRYRLLRDHLRRLLSVIPLLECRSRRSVPGAHGVCRLRGPRRRSGIRRDAVLRPRSCVRNLRAPATSAPPAWRRKPRQNSFSDG